MVAHKILVSAQGPLVFGIWVWGLGVWGLGLTIVMCLKMCLKLFPNVFSNFDMKLGGVGVQGQNKGQQ